MTNAEWLRSLSDEQLLDWLVDHACMTERSCNERCHDAKMCRACLKRWMETKAESSANMKEKTEFTPGPYNAVIEDHSMWDTGEYYTMFCIEAEKEGKKRVVAQLLSYNDKDDETEATTHLLAASPDMYALLDMMQTFLEVSGDENTRIAFLTQIRKVLAKARGEK